METPGEGSARGALRLEHVVKRYGDVRAVDDVSLDVRPGEFVTLLGPSGSGKTTTLGVIVGFVDPDAGRVVLDGRDVTMVPPYERDMGMVFQHYALFPHMSVEENVAFPLEMRRRPRAEIRRRVAEALDLVQLGGLGARRPRQLSGGQQQRVALARAVVFTPRLLLMDEPLGALDKKLRETLQLEIVRLSRRLGATVIYVTHDQEEALVMSDRVAVYHGGRIEQLAAGRELYERPRSLFVANFLGESNVLAGTLRAGGLVEGPIGPIRVSADAVAQAGLAPDSPVAVIVRPERMRIGPASRPDADASGDTAAVVGGVVRQVVYLGSSSKVVVEAGGATLLARVPAGQATPALEAGAAVQVAWDRVHGVLVPDDRASPAGP